MTGLHVTIHKDDGLYVVTRIPDSEMHDTDDDRDTPVYDTPSRQDPRFASVQHALRWLATEFPTTVISANVIDP